MLQDLRVSISAYKNGNRHFFSLRKLGFYRETVLTTKASITLRAYLTTEVARKSAMKNKY